MTGYGANQVLNILPQPNECALPSALWEGSLGRWGREGWSKGVRWGVVGDEDGGEGIGC